MTGRDDEFDTPPDGTRRVRRTSEQLFHVADLCVAAIEKQLGLRALDQSVVTLIRQYFGRAMEIGMESERHKTLALRRELDELREQLRAATTVPPKEGV